MKRILAWDDRPDEYFKSLERHLATSGLTMVTLSDAAEFRQRLEDETWDFIITDLVNLDATREKEDIVGRDLAQEALDKGYTVFVATRLVDTADLKELALPKQVIVKTKKTPPAFMAREIHQELRNRGLLPDADSVFVFGNGQQTGPLGTILDKGGLRHLVNDEGLETSDSEGWSRRVQGCAAILAVCYASAPEGDDSGNSLLETLLRIGFATGLPNGRQRIVVLQQWGEDPSAQARLPGSLSDLKTIRFEESVEEIEQALLQTLVEMGVNILP